MLTANEELAAIAEHFPHTDLCFGYGSGVFAQNNNSTGGDGSKKGGTVGDGTFRSVPPPPPPPPPSQAPKPRPMLDLILSVPCARSFHALNLRRFPEHYTYLSRGLGPSFVSAVQRQFGACVWFNPLVTVPVPNIGGDSPSDSSSTSPSRLIKYGVVQTSDLILDLTTWEHLYLAGRMHKPIGVVTPSSSIAPQLAAAMQANLTSGLCAGLLTSSSDSSSSSLSLSLSDLFLSISNLSYAGDPRMSLRGEDPNKVSKLVGSDGQLQRFNELYRPHLDGLVKDGLLSWSSGGTTATTTVEWDAGSATARRHLLARVADGRLAGRMTGGGADDKAVSKQAVRLALEKVVSRSASRQSAKGLLTAGIVRSAIYALDKFRKGGVLK